MGLIDQFDNPVMERCSEDHADDRKWAYVRVWAQLVDLLTFPKLSV